MICIMYDKLLTRIGVHLFRFAEDLKGALENHDFCCIFHCIRRKYQALQTLF